MTLLRGRGARGAMIVGALYGLLARAVASDMVNDTIGGLFAVMSLGFLFLVPLVIGAVTVGAAALPSVWYRIFAPWMPILLLLIVAGVIGWEGSICIFMGLPVMLVMASIGGLIAVRDAAHNARARPMLLIAPFLFWPLERQMPLPDRLRQTVTEIVIDAPPETVWPLVASVDSIRPEERRPSLFTMLGFPPPVSATLSHHGIGGVRIARFERGLAFTETVTEWVHGERLGFTIDATTDGVSAPPLDQHVMIGGPYFDVMTGGYELHPVNGGRATRLVLRSEHRTSTRFNFYAGWWADRVMASIQNNIMAVHKARAER